jgi:hypothetical protein
MTFTFPLLLGGLALIGVPVLIHFLMRHKPRTLQFPAFRFLLKRHRSNVTRLRLRHLLLLLLRIGLIAVFCLALTQPRIQENPWSLPTDQPAIAVFVFDTSASMDYTAANQSRLREAQKRAVELLKLLPEGSEIVLLDTHQPPAEGKTEWLTRDDAAGRIAKLKVEPANGPVTARLENALRLLSKLSGQKDKEQRWKRPRVLCVFSDRTQPSWQATATKDLQGLVDEVPPTFERLAALQAELPGLIKLLPDLRQRLTLAGDLNEQDLHDRLAKLRSRLDEVRADDYPDTPTTTPICEVRKLLRKLLAALPADDDKLAPEMREVRNKVATAARAVLRNSAGFVGLYLDVGIEQPTDLALVDFQLDREIPGPDDPAGTGIQIQLRIKAQATGQVFQPTLVTALGPKQEERSCEVKPGQPAFVLVNVPDELLDTKLYQTKVLAKPSDQLTFNNSRYLTYGVRKILVVADDEHKAQAQLWCRAIEAHRFYSVLFRCAVKRPNDVDNLGDYHAVFLCGLKKPESELWKQLKQYVAEGGGLGILPGDENMEWKTYNNNDVAKDVMPAKFDDLPLEAVGDEGGEWNWFDTDIYKHPFMHPYQEWRQGTTFDIARAPRHAWKYWKLKGLQGKSTVLVSYTDGKAALVERVVDGGKGRSGRVLLFTTPPGWQGWNDYFSNHSFGVALAGRAVGHLTGDAHRDALNFVSSRQGPHVAVPVEGRVLFYNLQRDVTGQGSGVIADVTVEKDQNEVQIPKAVEPGNYTLRHRDDPAKAVAWFSVNLPAEESNLTRVDKGAIEAVLGPDAVLAMQAQTDLKDAMQGHLSKPLELLPWLMVGLLLVLAVENLLGNKFYRREPEPTSS